MARFSQSFACLVTSALSFGAAAASASVGRSGLSDDALSSAILRYANKQYDDCKATGRCPRAEAQYDVLGGAVAYRSQTFAGGLRDPADAWWDGEDWAAGSIGLAPPPAATPIGYNASSIVAGGSAVYASPMAVDGLDTWTLGDSTIAAWPLHTPHFGIDSVTGSPCAPNPAPVVPNPYSYSYFTGPYNGTGNSNHTNNSSSSSVCHTCLLHVNTDSLELTVACPPGYSADNGEVAPSLLGTLGAQVQSVVNSSSSTNGSAIGWRVPLGASQASPPSAYNNSSSNAEILSNAAYPFVPAGWRIAVFTGQRKLSRNGDGVTVAVFHFSTLHIGTGTVVATRGAFPLALVTRGSIVVDAPIVVEPGSLGVR